MLLSLNWLKDFVEIPRALSAEELGLKLTMHTVEIDSVEKQVDKYKDIVIGKILEIKAHPDADRLSLVKVDVGAMRASPLQIVCGAPNIKEGQLVPVALVGAILPNGVEIAEAEVRGVKSQGMLCAEDELNLGDDHSGILILENKAKIGQNLGKYLDLKDVVFEVENKSLTHRPDLWSHYGIAREIAAFTGNKFKEYKLNKKLFKGIDQVQLDIKVEDFDLCPRYMVIAIEGIKVEASPKWMQDRLIAVGMRPINNIVDITNYVMLELGQPLHAFDKNLVDKIIVRRAKDNEVMETLDGEKRKLDKEMLVIADSSKPIAIAGVMGGANSEISSETRSIIIESANFNFISIRKTQTKLGLRTESSIRFEKALDPNLAELAIARTVELVKKLCPKAKVISQLVDLPRVAGKAGEKKFELDQGPVKLDLAWLNKIVGQAIEKNQVIEILEKLGFKTSPQPSPSKGEGVNTVLEVTVPTWRATRDISISEDLVEEVSRIFGFSNLTPSMPRVAMETPEISQERMLEKKIKTILSSGAALSEVYNYSFVGEEQLEKLGIDYTKHIKLANPIASHQTMLRQSLVPNLVDNVKINQARFENISIFEIGSIYLSNLGELAKDDQGKDKLPYQEKRLGIIIAASKKENVFTKTKGIIDYLLTLLNLSVNFTPIEIIPNWADKEASAKIIVGNQPRHGRVKAGKYLGLVTKLDSSIARNLGIKKQVGIAEISLRELFNIIKDQGIKKFKEFAKFPPVVRDLAFVVNENILYNDIRDEIVNFNQLIKSVELFDVYQGGKLGLGKKNLAFHIIYQADKTMTAKEVDQLQQELIKHLQDKFEAKIRDF